MSKNKCESLLTVRKHLFTQFSHIRAFSFEELTSLLSVIYKLNTMSAALKENEGTFVHNKREDVRCNCRNCRQLAVIQDVSNLPNTVH